MTVTSSTTQGTPRQETALSVKQPRVKDLDDSQVVARHRAGDGRQVVYHLRFHHCGAVRHRVRDKAVVDADTQRRGLGLLGDDAVLSIL